MDKFALIDMLLKNLISIDQVPNSRIVFDMKHYIIGNLVWEFEVQTRRN